MDKTQGLKLIDVNVDLWLGSTVQWASRGGMYSIDRIGQVICVVPPNKRPFVRKQYDLHNYLLPDGSTIPYSRTRYGGGLPRSETSCIVCVPGAKAGLSDTYYWPRINALQLIQD